MAYRVMEVDGPSQGLMRSRGRRRLDEEAAPRDLDPVGDATGVLPVEDRERPRPVVVHTAHFTRPKRPGHARSGWNEALRHSRSRARRRADRPRAAIAPAARHPPRT